MARSGAGQPIDRLAALLGNPEQPASRDAQNPSLSPRSTSSTPQPSQFSRNSSEKNTQPSYSQPFGGQSASFSTKLPAAVNSVPHAIPAAPTNPFIPIANSAPTPPPHSESFASYSFSSQKASPVAPVVENTSYSNETSSAPGSTRTANSSPFPSSQSMNGPSKPFVEEKPAKPVVPFKEASADTTQVAQKTAGEGAFVDDLFKKVRPLLDIIDRLRDCGLESLINLPRIAVVGEQSTGKSSCLEALVGEDFLPKSAELATRAPLWLRMIRDSSLGGLRALIGTAADAKHPVSFANIATAIRHYQDQLAGTSKGIVNKPVFLDIFAPDCPDLTLVDLPGVAKNPIVNSDQPDNIEEITKDLIGEFIRDKETVILAVVPANMDIAASDAIKLARRFDPSGDRTIGVLTKIDIMDLGTNARRILSGEYVKLKLGFVAVKNRSQKELNDGITVREGIKVEARYFSEHAAYKDLPPAMFGVKSLAKRLMQILGTRIAEILPSLRDQVSSRASEVEERLSRLGEETPEDEIARRRLVITLLKEYADAIATMLDGTLDTGRYESIIKEDGDVFGLAVLSGFFQEFAEALVGMSIDKLLTDDEIRRQIRNTAGTSLPNFLSFRTFKLLIRPPIERMSRPSMECVEKTYRYLQEICYKLAKEIFGRFPLLLESVRTVTDSLLMNLRSDSREKISHIIEHQRYVYTSNPDYLRLTSQRPSKANDSLITHSEVIDEVKELRTRLNAYYDLVKKVISDEVTRTVGWSFQNGLQTRLFLDLESNLTSELDRLLAESLEKVELRKRLKAERDVLTEAAAVLSRSREQLVA
eukprot:CAMPEP_0184350994 /NCGR_PEP_ID=MMETSP1089-20130417/43307_1 /TAXON_ID=38269 ORGANISM="Gloeochaete wittrockiana, Strain SAG46.84" /NCGR_SAMPLE_ID=MMETSP1089 /ASSEMBLY_ACC=CAM_ASM_000445 /LENGTH=816 /DNA_ID=CAMNT_0026684165 /DNA_START=17 /DNA_END=2467 /DNA_ORIENTATION=+